MAIPANKAELEAAIRLNFDKLMRDLERVPEARAREPALPGHGAGTMISPADLLAYLIGWNELVLKWLAQDDRGTGVDFPETGFKWNALGALAQKFYTDCQALGWPELLTRLRQAQTLLLATVASRSDAELYGRPWYGKWSKGRMIQLNSASPYTNARGRIRAWLKAQA